MKSILFALLFIGGSAQARNYSNAFTPISVMDNYLLAHPPLVSTYSAEGKWQLAVQGNKYEGSKFDNSTSGFTETGDFNGKALAWNFKYGILDISETLRLSTFVFGMHGQFTGDFDEHFDVQAQNLNYSNVKGNTNVIAAGISVGESSQDIKKFRSEVFFGLYHLRTGFKQTMTQTKDSDGTVLFDFDVKIDPRMTGFYYGLVFDTPRWYWLTTWGLKFFSFSYWRIFGSTCQDYEVTSIRSDPFNLAGAGTCSANTDHPDERGIDYDGPLITIGMSLVIAESVSIDILSPFYIKRFIKSEGLDASFISLSYTFGNVQKSDSSQ